MSAKTMAKGAGTLHTAGIFSDMTVDGPEIGTLVLIVDRAKNLPNRKTIGKQDPYCAARLGKEAKKTETDRRGGQTPRWDEELRFTVHDSPDYYQLKISVFNDDKKTDLIGEAWINLEDLLVPGGGQNDLWHSLNYRSKYAGEIRIEMTYYDTRPKPEKPSERIHQSGINGSQEAAREGRDGLSGPRQPKAAVKRRPLPSDPTASPSVTPPEHQRSSREHRAPTTYIQTQSPLQAVEYGTPTHRPRRATHHGSTQYEVPHRTPQHELPHNHTTPPGMAAHTQPHAPPYTQPHSQPHAQPHPQQMSHDQYQMYSQGRSGHRQNSMHEEDVSPRGYYNPHSAAYDQPPPAAYDPLPSPEGPPPPPPKHASSTVPSLQGQAGYGFPAPEQKTPPQNGIQRKSMPPSSHGYQAYSPTIHQEIHGAYEEPQYRARHQSYDERAQGYGSMQPSVEDAPMSPPQHGRSDLYDDVPSPAPLSLNGRHSAASGRNSASTLPSRTSGWSSVSPVSFRDSSTNGTSISSRTSYSQTSVGKHQRHHSMDPASISQDSYGLPSVPPTLVAGMDPMIAQEVADRIYQEKRTSYSSQTVGASPRGRWQDTPQYQEAMASRPQPQPHPLSHGEVPGNRQVSRTSTHSSRPVSRGVDFEQEPRRVSRGSMIHSRSASPISIPRKSVSPSPSMAVLTANRRISAVPFGPDDYDAFNPSVRADNISPGPQYSTPDGDHPVHMARGPDEKIITYDGREIDPSDHLPPDTYAPEPEKRGERSARERSRPPGAQRRQLRQQGRPQSMSAAVPSHAAGAQYPVQNAPAYMTTPIYLNTAASESSPAVSGRNRLQKKANRMSAQPATVGGSSTRSDFAPSSFGGSNFGTVRGSQDDFVPRALPRAKTGDFAGPGPGTVRGRVDGGEMGGTGTIRGQSRGPPMVPLKGHVAAESDAWALLEEMKNIDLGVGRARRRGR